MIELKNLTKKEAYDLVRGCEPFYLKTQNMKWQGKVHNILMETFGRKYRIPIQVVVTAACKAVRYGLTGSQFPLRKSVYAEVNKKRPTNKISPKLTRELLSLMEDAGYLTILKGYFKSKDDSMMTCLRFHDKLLNNLDKECCERWGISRLKDYPVIEVIDSTKSIKNRNVFKDPQFIRGSKPLQDQVTLVNREIEKHLVTYNGETCSVLYKRRFENNLQSGGRWYVIGTFQTEEKDFRNTIRIDSEPTTEIDISHIHPSILASISGFILPKDYDPYDISFYVRTPINREDLRDFIKPCFMALLYASERNNALHEIRKKLWSNNRVSNWLDAETILESLEEHNYILKDYFYKKDNWKLCQFLDSCIATKIMVHFAHNNKVALNYHDSWIVKTKDKQELISVIEDAWMEVIGNDDNLYYKVEFENK